MGSSIIVICRHDEQNGEEEAFELEAASIQNPSFPSSCLGSTLYAVKNGGGLGNAMFELLGLYAIAQTVKRQVFSLRCMII